MQSIVDEPDGLPTTPAPAAVEVVDLSKRYRPREPATIVPVPWLLSRRRRRPVDDQSAPPLLGREDLEDDLNDVEVDEQDEEAPYPARSDRDVWALRDVSFTLPSGRFLGVIGENGAGKSTLLQVLSRITPPTSGWGVVRGRMAPMIGTAELFLDGHRTGVQNVCQAARFFNVPRSVAQAAIEPIREFTELGDALDTPTKTYSSGQRRRLAYAMSLHLDPDVLLSDGVVGVGDHAFQARCFAALQDHVEQGLTVILATHDLKLVRRLCTDVLLLKAGRLEALGQPDEVVSKYETEFGSKAAARARAAVESWASPAAAEEGASLVAKAAGIYDMDGRPTELLRTSDDALLEVTFELLQAPKRLRCVIDLMRDGRRSMRLAQPAPHEVEATGIYAASVHVPAGTLAPGSYEGRASILERVDEGKRTLARTTVRFEVTGDGGDVPEPVDVRQPQLPWDMTRIGQTAAR